MKDDAAQGRRDNVNVARRARQVAAAERHAPRTPADLVGYRLAERSDGEESDAIIVPVPQGGREEIELDLLCKRTFKKRTAYSTLAAGSEDPEARRVSAIILEVLGGGRTPTQGARGAGDRPVTRHFCLDSIPPHASGSSSRSAFDGLPQR